MDQMVIVRNWRNVRPVIAHKSGLDWRLLSMAGFNLPFFYGTVNTTNINKMFCLLLVLSFRKSLETHLRNCHIICSERSHHCRFQFCLSKLQLDRTYISKFSDITIDGLNYDM